MYTLAEFKKAHNLTAINFGKGKGRSFADVLIAGKEERIFASEGFDPNKPEKYIFRGAHDAYWVTNNRGLQPAFTL